MTGKTYTSGEMMTVAAARLLPDGAVCFVGIGKPSAACVLASMIHAPNLVLIYESGTVGTRPSVLPLSIGDGELADTADAVVPLTEIFSHYLQGGRIDVGFLGAAQIDRFGNLNSTVIGPYDAPSTRLPGAGGAPEIITHARDIFVIMNQTKRGFVDKLDFRTSAGLLNGGGERRRKNYPGRGPSVVVTDFGLLRPDAETDELTLVSLFDGAKAEDAVAATGWPLRVAGKLDVIAPPTTEELEALRDLNARTEAAHRTPVKLHLKKTA
ncbi:CoA-transferase subunit beta [Kordiimonas marina]|uniref:CoA-transferase subunit beta n=1 Tax=Kordiimonas marina TaxID=2872312 RepID=UPI001FF38868|nr:CoA-transferase [Kordiimonas marina]MCJ9430646.1 hypothetical protein [Kordiimonas marina]